MIEIEHSQPAAWRRVRAIRLRVLADAPDAFGKTLAQDRALPDATWRGRLEDRRAATFLARRGGRDVGLVVVALWSGRPDAAGLFAMWVAPEARGRGVGDRLVEAVLDWAREQGYRRVLLDVKDGNRPAIGLYERWGFAPTGVTGSLPPPRTHIREHQRALEL